MFSRRLLRPSFACLRRRLLSKPPAAAPLCCGSGGGSLEEAERETLTQFSEQYVSKKGIRFTETLSPVFPSQVAALPIYRVMDFDGRVLNELEDPNLHKETLVKMYKDMTLLNQMDKVLYDAQRQGRISFYMTNSGEEVCNSFFRPLMTEVLYCICVERYVNFDE